VSAGIKQEENVRVCKRKEEFCDADTFANTKVRRVREGIEVMEAKRSRKDRSLMEERRALGGESSTKDAGQGIVLAEKKKHGKTKNRG